MSALSRLDNGISCKALLSLRIVDPLFLVYDFANATFNFTANYDAFHKQSISHLASIDSLLASPQVIVTNRVKQYQTTSNPIDRCYPVQRRKPISPYTGSYSK